MEILPRLKSADHTLNDVLTLSAAVAQADLRNMITWASNVLNGRLRHWNEANNNYVSALAERAKRLPAGIEPLLFGLIAASYNLVNYLVGPDRGTKRIIKKDPNDITAEQFQALHHLNIWTFVALFRRQNPHFPNSFSDACTELIGIRKSDLAIAEYIAQMKAIDGDEFFELCSKHFAEIAKILDYKDWDFRDCYMFASLFAVAYSDAIKSYKESAG